VTQEDVQLTFEGVGATDGLNLEQLEVRRRRLLLRLLLLHHSRRMTHTACMVCIPGVREWVGLGGQSL